MLELEKKILLTEKEYICLLDHFCKDTPAVKQINYYFDTDVLSMNRQDITCRIRLKNDKYVGTMKRHIPSSDNSIEREIGVRDGILDNDFIDMGLELQGELVTERNIAIKNDFIEMVLDKNEYLGCIDYELEIEYVYGYEHSAIKFIEMVLNILNSSEMNTSMPELINRVNSSKSKCKRFFERLLVNKRRELFE